jgi:hypothetical protein
MFGYQDDVDGTVLTCDAQCVRVLYPRLLWSQWLLRCGGCLADVIVSPAAGSGHLNVREAPRGLLQSVDTSGAAYGSKHIATKQLL